MRIAMMQADLPPVGAGGVAYQVDLLANALSNRKHEVVVFTGHGTAGDRTYVCVDVRAKGGPTVRRFLGIPMRYRQLDLHQFDVVHAHGDDWAMRRSVPRVRTFYGSALMEALTARSWRRRTSQLLGYGLEWLSIARADKTVAISHGTARSLPVVRTFVPCAFDPALFFGERDPAPYPRLLAVAGSLGGRKRGALLLAAFREVRKVYPRAELVLVTRDKVKVPGVRVVMAPSRAQLGRLYRTSWILCSASSYEGFGVPYIEALASGAPVVTTTNAGAREVLEDGRLGVLCRPDALGETVVRLIADERRRGELAASGLEASSRYRVENVAAEYESIYAAALAR